MARDAFSRRVEEAGNRLADLMEEVLSANRAPADDELVQRLLHELSTGIEELRVAEEELIVQGEQLSATHHAVDAERERYGRLFDFAPDGYLETDQLGKILEANLAASRLLGVPVRFLVNKLVASFIPDADRRRVRNLLVAAGDGVLPEGEVRVQVVPRHGSPVPVGITVGADLDPRDGELRVRWLLRDLTERLKEEEERRVLQDEVDLLVALGDVARLTAGDDPLASVLGGLLDIACGVLDDGTVSITVASQHGQLSTAAAVDEVASRLSGLQHEADEGPCVEAARRLVITEASMREIDERWPTFARAARAEEIVEVFGLPIAIDDVAHGALNVYSRRPTTAASRGALRLLAAQASAAVANAELYRSAARLAEQLTAALETRVVIEQAKGALMALQKIDADEAFDILRRASQRRNQKLREIAAELLERTIRPEPTTS